MFVGIGVGIGRNRFAQGIFDAYNLRVVADGGITEAGQCVNAVSGLLLNASLLLIPSGYKGGKAYAEIPTNGNGDLTWTRASDAWRTNDDGLIQRVPWNLASWSETFENAYWTKTGASVSANSTTAPNGTATADLVYATASGSTKGIFTNAISVVSGTTYTWSVYAKPSGKSWIYINCWTGSGAGAYFNVTNGTVGTISSGVTASITNVGDGWYRCVATRTSATTTSSGGAEFYITDADNSLSVTASGTNGIYIWGAQLVEGSSAQTYFPTTDRLNVPRLSYMYGSCPALLLEPQRTNLALQSAQFDNAYWSKTATVTSNTTISPSGSQDADTFTDSSNSYDDVRSTSISITANATYTASVFIKKTTATLTHYPGIGILLSGITNRLDFGILNTTTGQVVRDGSSNINVATYSTQSVGDYWRLIVTFTDNLLNTNCGIYFYPAISSNGTSISPTAQGSNVFWGAQLEAGAYPTTYIPTTTASATRIADSFSRNNIYTNGLITSSGGTWFVELRGNVAYTRDAGNSNLFIGNAANNSPSNALEIRNGGVPNTRLDIGKRIGGTYTQLFASTTNTIKVALKWNGTSVDLFVNGTKEVTASSFSITNMEFLYLQNQDVPKFIQAMALYPSPLSDTDCTTLTTL